MFLFLRSFCFDMFYRVFVCRSVAELVDFNEVCDMFFFWLICVHHVPRVFSIMFILCTCWRK